MGYERGYIPPFHEEDRPRPLPLSWKAVVLAIAMIALMMSPFIAMWLS